MQTYHRRTIFMKNSTQGLQAVLTFDNIWMAALLNFGQVFRRQYYLWIHCIQCKNKAFILKPAAMFPINTYIYLSGTWQHTYMKYIEITSSDYIMLYCLNKPVSCGNLRPQSSGEHSKLIVNTDEQIGPWSSRPRS